MAASVGAANSRDRGTFTAKGAPYVDVSLEDDACWKAFEGVHKTTHIFTARRTGIVKASMKGFDGDWDLFLTNGKDVVLAQSWQSQTLGAPPSETVATSVTKGTRVSIVACNSLSSQLETLVKWWFVPEAS